MSGEAPKLDPQVLHSAAATFSEAAAALSSMRTEEVVGDAALSVGELRTVESCRRAQEGITAAIAATADSVREYTESLDGASRTYSTSDQAAAEAIAGTDIPT